VCNSGSGGPHCRVVTAAGVLSRSLWLRVATSWLYYGWIPFALHGHSNDLNGAGKRRVLWGWGWQLGWGRTTAVLILEHLKALLLILVYEVNRGFERSQSHR